MAPRSSATTFNPASVSSLARMPPVQPRPTMTTSTSGSLVAMARAPSAHVRDAERLAGEWLVTVMRDVITMDRDDSGKADDCPSGLVAVAAIDRVGIHALDHGLIQRRPEHPHRQAAVESDLAGGEPGQHLLPLVCSDPVECVAVGLAAMRIGCRDAGAVELGRRQWQLVALCRSAEFPRSLHIKTVALAPAARQSAVDVNIDAEICALRTDFVGRDHVIDQSLDESRLIKIEKRVADGFVGGR